MQGGALLGFGAKPQKKNGDLMKVVMIDLIGEYNKWMAFNLKEETEIIKYITKGQFINGDGNFLCEKNYDVILVAENDIKDKEFLNAMFRCLGISEKKAIFINDLNSWAEHETIAYEILRNNNISRRHTEFLTWKKFGKFASVTVDDISYFGESNDDKIMGDMYINNKNFAKTDMEAFLKLSEKFYPKLKGKYFLDIGANIGAKSIYFYKKLDPDIQILAFEPAPLTYKILACNLILNDMLDVVRTENLVLNDGKNIGGNEKAITLDNYLKDNNILNSEIKYIWIDQMGYESKILMGAEYLISHSKVPLLVNFNPKLYYEEEVLQAFVEFLSKHYRGFIRVDEAEEENAVLHKIEELKTYKNNENLNEYNLFFVGKD